MLHGMPSTSAHKTTKHFILNFMEYDQVSTEERVQQITYRPKERMELFTALPLAERSAVFNALSAHVRSEILKRLSLEDTIELLDHLDLRRAQVVLTHIKSGSRRKRIISRLKNDRYAKVEHFLQFHPQATLALLHLNFVLLPDATTVGETANVIEDHLRHTGKIPEVLVSRDGEIVGEVPLGTLVRERNSSKLRAHLKEINTIPYTTAPEDAITRFTTAPHTKVAVLDNDGSVLGVIYSDDVIDLLDESPAATLYSFAGVEESERPFDDIRDKIQHRYKWLILNLFTGFLAASVIAFFESTLAQVVLLAMYMPIISGMGGNAATQTLAVMVRGIAVGEISLRNCRPALMREVAAGMTNGAITGSIVALIAWFFNGDPLLGVVVGLAIVINLMVAGIAGTTIPLVLRYFGKDPATSATIFITTATDVLGFLSLLSLATIILL